MGICKHPGYCRAKTSLRACQPQQLLVISPLREVVLSPLPAPTWPGRKWQVRGADGSKRQENKRGPGLESGIQLNSAEPMGEIVVLAA